jgi:hypothetical protein
MAAEIEREDGFTLVHSEGGGWDIHAPSPDLSDLPAELLEYIARRGGPRRTGSDPSYSGPERRTGPPERRLGPWFSWVLSTEDAEPKIEREKRERLFH